MKVAYWLAILGCVAWIAGCGGGTSGGAGNGGNGGNGGSGGSGAPPTLALTPSGGNNQSGPTGTFYPTPLTVTATSNGTPVPGVTVTFSDGSGGGTFSAATGTTNASGMVSTFYSPLSGTQSAGGNDVATITATSTGYSPATFTETITDISTQLCGSTDITGYPDEPTQPENSCATGTTTLGAAPNPSPPWGTLQVEVCNIAGIPAAGLGNTTCTDPQSVPIQLSYPTGSNQPVISASLVTVNSFPNGTTLVACGNNGIGNVAAMGQSRNWNITQTTADFWYGMQMPSPQCSVLFTDNTGQAILVKVGFQVSVYCAEASCGPVGSALKGVLGESSPESQR